MCIAVVSIQNLERAVETRLCCEIRENQKLKVATATRFRVSKNTESGLGNEQDYVCYMISGSMKI